TRGIYWKLQLHYIFVWVWPLISGNPSHDARRSVLCNGKHISNPKTQAFNHRERHMFLPFTKRQTFSYIILRRDTAGSFGSVRFLVYDTQVSTTFHSKVMSKCLRCCRWRGMEILYVHVVLGLASRPALLKTQRVTREKDRKC
uniref:Uncharacterized protein n=1 Tax=Neogobius melanostomus TaxID=47308 RepID=A0A8C6WXE6_9GOBI